MSSLFDQPVRNSHAIEEADAVAFMEAVKRVAKKSKTTIDQVLKGYEVLERSRTNQLYKSNGDTWDEQIAGIGEILKDLTVELQDIASRIQQESE